MSRSHRSRIYLFLVLAALVGCCALTVVEAEEADPGAAGTEDSIASRLDGPAVAAEKGTARAHTPTRETVRELRAAIQSQFTSARASGVVIRGADGTLTLVLDERHSLFSIARIGPDGKLSTRCVAGAGHAETVLAGDDDDGREEE